MCESATGQVGTGVSFEMMLILSLFVVALACSFGLFGRPSPAASTLLLMLTQLPSTGLDKES